MLAWLFLLFSPICAFSQDEMASAKENESDNSMKTYVIERNIPDAGLFTHEQLKGISQTSCSVLNEMGPDIQWIHSYVVEDKIFCVYKAKNKDLLYEHAKKGGFPINNIFEVSEVISPKTAE